MNCPSRIEIERSLDGAPAARGAPPIEAHLEECAGCRTRTSSVESLDALLLTALLECNPKAARVPPRLLGRLISAGEEELERRAERAQRSAGGSGRFARGLRRSAAWSGALPWVAVMAAVACVACATASAVALLGGIED